MMQSNVQLKLGRTQSENKFGKCIQIDFKNCITLVKSIGGTPSKSLGEN